MILNLTQHNASEEQIQNGVIDLSGTYKEELTKALNFTNIPGTIEINERVQKICEIVNSFIKEHKLEHVKFMIGGALWLMKPLIEELSKIGPVLFAFSKRETTEIQENGKTIKTTIFKHIGFIEAI